MNVNVENDNYIPNTTESIISNIFKDTKISFIILLILVIIIYIAIFILLSKKEDNAKNNYIILSLEIFLWIVLIYIIYINIKNYDDKNYDFQINLENLFNSKLSELKVDVSNNNLSPQPSTCLNGSGNKEVFHISNNKYNYRQAKQICEHYDSRLATYNEIENAYNNGASWCSYGWSSEQMAFFPTSKKIYNELKKIPTMKHNCGRPGVNGGFIHNPNVKFGVNCYGVKPKPKKIDKKYMHSFNHTINKEKNNPSKETKSFEDDLVIASFNKDKWTKY